jgi:DNA-binding response OmpR family regulator
MEWLEKGSIPDMIISEIHVPHLDGGQLLQVIRNSNLYKHIPFLMLSTQDDSTTRINYLDNGADGYLMKPFNPMEVKAKAKAILRRIYHYVD